MQAEIERRQRLTEAQAAVAEAERLAEELHGKALDHEAENERCATDIEYWFDTYVWTYDPRLALQKGSDGNRLSPYVQFKLWPKQREFVHWLEALVDANEEGLGEKSRDAGATYLCAGFALHHWLYVDGFKATFGSRNVDLVDRRDDPDSIFEKLRVMWRRLPSWMMPKGFNAASHDNYRRLFNPETGATITGEGGDEMGRGGRSSLYVVDEAAFVPNAEKIEKALSGNTDCVLWLSSVNGMGNLFARKRFGTLDPRQIFRLHWRDDPRKTEEWARAKQASLSDPSSWASEYDIDYSASVAGVCIPAIWVESAKRLLRLEKRIEPSNVGVLGLDVGAGKAKSVAIERRGAVVTPPRARGEPDTTGTAHWALDIAKERGLSSLLFDAPGVGAGVSSTLNLNKVRGLTVSAINTGLPASTMRWPDGRTSVEMFANIKAEIWWITRTRLQRTHEHVRWLEEQEGGVEHPITDLLALPSGDVESDTLCLQLSMVKWERNERGKIAIETKDSLRRRGVISPDHADALVLTFAEGNRPIVISDDVLKRSAMRTR